MVDEVVAPISLADYAAHRGCSKQAVAKAVDKKRLIRSVVRVSGQPKIADIALADQEWESNSGRTSKAKGSVASGVAQAPPADVQVPTTIQETIHPGNVISASTLIEAQRIATLERARKLKLENDEAELRLVLVEKVKKDVFEVNRIVRENILNIPARIAGELAAESDTGRVYLRLDAALREALGQTADRLAVIA